MAAPSDLLDRSDVNLVGEERLDLTELQRLVGLSGLGTRPVAGRKKTVFSVVDSAGRKYKVRAFRNADAAQEKLNLVAPVRHLFAPLYGRIGHCVVWGYAEGNGEAKESVATEAARFLTQLAQVEFPPLSEQQFAGWCEEIGRSLIFLPASLRLMLDYYRENLHRAHHWNIEYMDAVPKNFVFDENGRCVCIDAKHLFVGPRGLGLVKLACQRGIVASEDYCAELLRAYRQEIPLEEYDDPRYLDFVRFYYCMMLLQENAHYLPCRHNLESKQNRWRKRLLLDMVKAPAWLRLAEEAVLAVPFYTYQTRIRITEALRSIF
jgi:hypothetical protein